jgi:DNA-binding beta-propeller fold protein YncE
MKKLTVMLITALLLTAVTAAATGYVTVFHCHRYHFWAHRGGSTEPVAEFDLSLGFTPYGLTYDGGYWWVTDSDNDRIYAFDYGGDYVSDFPSPAPDPESLAFDGEYLWVCCNLHSFENSQIYQVGLDGSPGPYGDFEAGAYTGLTYLQGQLYVMNSGGGIEVYEPDGTYERFLTLDPGTWDYYGIALADDEEYIWASLDIEARGVSRVYAYDPETGERIPGLGGWGAAYNLGCGIWSESCIEVESLGKIKAFFDNERGDNNNVGE